MCVCVCVCVCVCIFFFHSSVDGYPGCFHILANVNNATVNIGYIYLLKLVFCVLQLNTQKWGCLMVCQFYF